MKIAFDAKRYYHNDTGLGNYSRTLIKGLKEADSQNEILLYDEKTLSRTFYMGRMAQRDGASLFHGLSNELPFDIRKAGIPSIVTMHDVCWRTFPQMYKPIDRMLYDWKYGWAARNADCVLAISESTRQDLIHYFQVPEERIRVIYQPVGNIYYTPITKQEAWGRICDSELPELPSEFMLYVGTVNARKNLLGVIRAMALLPESCRLPLVVIGGGSGAYKQMVLSEINRSGLQDRVIWVSCFDNSLLQALYTVAALFVYPSFYEGFGLPVVEAALSGCPVVTSNVSSLPEAGGPFTLQAQPSSIEDLAQKMEKSLCDSGLREEMIVGARNYALAKFTPKVLFGQVLDLYREMSLPL